MKSFKLLVCVASLLVMGLLAAPAQAGTLYGATSAGGPGELFILNSANGAVLTDVGPLNDASGLNYPITGLAFNPLNSVLFGSTGNAGSVDAKLVTINPATGLVTPIGNFNAGPTNSGGSPATMADLSFDPFGNLYGVASIGGPQLFSINVVTAQATLIGASGITSTSGGGLAISSTGTFYGTPTSSRFGTYNPFTGAFTDITNPVKPLGGSYAALAFDANQLYGLNLGPGSPAPAALVTINPITGTVTNLGNTVSQLDAIAFAPTLVVVPLPSGFWMGLATLTGLLTWQAAARRKMAG